ncbi:MAG: hypothetical protein ACI8Z1_001726 [Candidatus Azotimanducaceae bacterium]
MGLLPDYMSVKLMVLDGLPVPKNQSSFVLLSGAWGLCFLSELPRVGVATIGVLNRTATEIIDIATLVLSFTLFLSLVSFIIALVFCLLKRN